MIRFAETSKFKLPSLQNGDSNTCSEGSKEVKNLAAYIIGMTHGKCLIIDNSYYYGAVLLWVRPAAGALYLVLPLIFITIL